MIILLLAIVPFSTAQRPVLPVLVDTLFYYDQTVGYQQSPAVAFDGTNFCVVWQDGRLDPDTDIVFIRVNQAGHPVDSTARVLFNAPGRQVNPSVAFDGSNYCVLWEQGNTIESDIYGARISPAGDVLDTIGFCVCNAPGRQSSPALCFGRTLYWAVWADAPSGQRIFGSRIDPSGIVVDTSAMQLSAYPSYTPSIAFEDPYFILVFQYDNSGDADIFKIQLDESGVISGGPCLVESGAQIKPCIASDSTRFLLVWQDDRNGQNWDIYGARLNHDGVIIDTSGFTIVDHMANQQNAAVTFSDPLFYITWEDNRNVTYDIYGARVTQAGTVMDTNGYVISNRTYYQTRSSIAGGDSVCLVAWQDHRSGYGDDIFGTALTASGAVTDTVGILYSRYCNAQQHSSATFDGTRYYVVWHDNRDSVFHDIYGIHVNEMGFPIDAASLPICTARYDQFNPASAFDGRNHIVVWEDKRNVVNLFDLYGTRVAVDGTVLDTQGIEIITGYGEQHDPAIAYGSGQYFVVWQDDRSGPGNIGIYGSRIDTTGVVVDTTGRMIANEYYHEQRPDICYDGQNYFVVWEDSRDQTHVYGTRINADGVVIDTAGIAIATVDYSWVPQVAYGMGMYLAVWIDARSIGGLYGARVDTNGTVLDTLGFLIDEGGHVFGHPSVAFNGADFIVSWFSREQLNATTHIFGKVITPDGLIIDSFAVCDQHVEQREPALVHGTQDQVLITYTGWADTSWGHLIQADRIWSVVYPFVGISEIDRNDPGNMVRLNVSPNPMKHGCMIKLHFPDSGLQDNVKRLGIYDITGRMVWYVQLCGSYFRSADILWNGCDQHGQPCPAGIYFCCLQSQGQIATEKIVKIK